MNNQSKNRLFETANSKFRIKLLIKTVNYDEFSTFAGNRNSYPNSSDCLKSLLGELSEEWIFATEGENKWSSFDVVGHYIHAEETDWIPRAEVILRQGEDKMFPPFDRFGHIEIVKG